MAGEITFSGSLAVKKGSLNENISRSGLKFDMAATVGRKSESVQNVGTTEEVIALNADLGSPGWAFFSNYDTTNYVELGSVVSATFSPVLNLGPGESQFVKLAAGVTLYGRANTAPVDLEVVVFSA